MAVILLPYISAAVSPNSCILFDGKNSRLSSDFTSSTSKQLCKYGRSSRSMKTLTIISSSTTKCYSLAANGRQQPQKNYLDGFKQSLFVDRFSRSTLSSPGKSRKYHRSQPRAAADNSHTSGDTGMTELLSFKIPTKTVKICFSALVTVLLGVANRILYKLALVPLKEYPFFLAQFTTFGYVAVYFAVLGWRYRSGIVTREMLALPKRRFVLMGALEAMGLASGMAASAVLPGAIIPILTQTFLVWQLALSYVILGKRYLPLQVIGCLLEVVGVIIVVASGSGAGDALASAGLWPLLLAMSTVFPAGSSILKEFVFKDAKERLKGGSLDLFVVNSFSSGFQALFVLLLLPVLSSLKGIPPRELPSFLRAGAACFLNAPGSGCRGAPLLPLLYVVGNLSFNVSMLNLLRSSSALVASFCSTISVPLTIFAFTFPLPFLGQPAPLPPGFLAGSLVLVAGLAMYNFAGSRQKQQEQRSLKPE
eukprot:jgi/Mesen1/6112/ME000310S05197